MCGLVGIVNASGKYAGSLDKIFSQSLIVDSVRGSHSTGAFFLSSTGKGNIYKSIDNAIDFTKTTRYNELINQTNKVLMGHNRYATIGNVTGQNAHPFRHNHITLAHNGTLRHYDKLTSKSFSTDSETITYIFSTKGVVPSLEEIEGDYALTWHNAKASTFNLCRNSKRDLYLAKIQDGIYMYASEIEIITWISKRNNIFIKDNDIIKIEPGRIYTIDLNNGILDDSVTFKINTKFTSAKHVKFSGYDKYYGQIIAGHIAQTHTPDATDIQKAGAGHVFEATVDHFMLNNGSQYVGTMFGYFNYKGTPEIFRVESVAKGAMVHFLQTVAKFRIIGFDALTDEYVATIWVNNTQICRACNKPIHSSESTIRDGDDIYHKRCAMELMYL